MKELGNTTALFHVLRRAKDQPGFKRKQMSEIGQLCKTLTLTDKCKQL